MRGVIGGWDPQVNVEPKDGGRGIGGALRVGLTTSMLRCMTRHIPLAYEASALYVGICAQSYCRQHCQAAGSAIAGARGGSPVPRHPTTAVSGPRRGYGPQTVRAWGSFSPQTLRRSANNVATFRRVSGGKQFTKLGVNLLLDRLGVTSSFLWTYKLESSALSFKRTEGVRKIAARFGVDPGTVQRISRPFVDASAPA